MAKERSGYVFEKNGNWYARLTFTNEQGKRKDIKRLAVNKTEAKKLLKSLLHELEDKGSKTVEASRMTFNHLADFYESHYLFPAQYVGGRKVAGLRDWKHVRYFLRIFRDYFGNRLLRELTHASLRAFRSHRLNIQTQHRRQRTITTVNRELSCLRRILNIAEQEGFIHRNPFRSGDSLISATDEVKRERVLTHEEEVRLLAACNGRRTHLRSFLIAALDTAMRSGELMKLRWSNVCFESGLITIRAENSKTNRSRIVAMTPRLRDELLQLWNKSRRESDTHVFGIKNNVRKSFASACEAAGIDGFRLHDARHSALTRMIAAGVAPMEAMKVSGHSQYATFARYINPTEQAVKKAADALALFNSQIASEAKSTSTSELVN
jgi:integrase